MTGEPKTLLTRRLMNRWVISLALLVLLTGGVAGYFWWASNDTVELSGMVQAEERPNGSKFGGRVSDVLVSEGDTVRKGQVLVKLDDVEISSKLADAQAALTQAQAREGLVGAGADSEDIRQAAAQVAQAREHLKLLQNGASSNEITQAQAQVNSAQTAERTAKSALESAQRMLAAGIISPKKLELTQADYDSAVNQLSAAKAKLQELRRGARPEEIRIAQAQLVAAQSGYEKLLKGTKPGEKKIASASVTQAQTAVNSLSSQVGELAVTSPINGVVSVLSVSPGELVGPGRPVVSVINYQKVWTDTYIPESDLNFVRLGQAVEVTAPAYPDAVFRGKVSFINPKSEFVPKGGSGAASTDDASFRVKVALEHKAINADKRLFPGMMVNVRFIKGT